MLTKLLIRNFKQFREVEIELGNPVVFVGPNNSGKTTALQALALWNIGLRRWNEKRAGKATPGRRPGVTINRKDLIAIPIPDANLLWRDLRVRDVQRAQGTQETKNIRVDIEVEGVTRDVVWSCGLEFDYANEESFYCRPLRLSDEKSPERMPIPEQAADVSVAYLPPMSGLSSNETRLEPGAINVRLGEGRTAEVLRNLCYQVVSQPSGDQRWKLICDRIRQLFGASLDEPRYIAERGEIAMTYRTQKDIRLDLASSGRGMQQVLLLLAHIELNSRCILLLDEPDAHLEILRQRQTYELLTRAAAEHACQIIIASHSEVILNEAANRDVVVAFVGQPHRIDDRRDQVRKALREISYDQFLLAEQTGWVLYLEGSTDLAILQAFATILQHPAQHVLKRPFVRYIANQPAAARNHFRGLREAKPDLVGFLLCDRLDRPLQPTAELRESMWERREIENYLCQPETLLAFAEAHDRDAHGPLFAGPETARQRQAMEDSIHDHVPRAALRNRSDRWWIDTKASDDVLDRVFESYLQRLNLPNSLLKKQDYHILARFVSPAAISPEVPQMLDQIFEISEAARPRGLPGKQSSH